MKITLNDISAQNSVPTASTTINNNNDAIETAFENTLSRDGTSPNQMLSDFDMNSKRILNLPAPVNADEPLRYQDLSTFVGGGTVTNIPKGGNTNDVLTKASNTDYDVDWSSAASEVTAGANILVTGASPATVATTQNPNFTTSVTTPNLVLNGTTISSVTGTGSAVLATSPTLVTPALGTPASGVATNLTGTAAGLTAGHVTTNANLAGAITSVGNATLLGSFTSTNLAAALTDETGTGSVVFATSPTLVTPILGTPTSGVATNLTGTAAGLTAGNVTTNANLTGAVISVGNATSLGSFTSANLSTALTDETGSGSAVFATSPTLVTPALGTPSAVVLTNATGTAASLTAGNVTTNANLTGPITSVGNATSITSQTGTGTKFVVDASPTLTGTPLTPTAAVDTNTTQIASTAFVLAQAGSATPVIDGTGTVGTSTRFARQDHVHPTDTTRAALASPTFTGTPAAPTAAVDTNTTQLATTAMVLAQAASATPLIDGTATVGTSTRFARGDHIHPTDTTRAPTASPTFTGTTTASGLLDISGASAGQISFPATQNPSAGANVFDDYKEGTWTPVLTFVTPGDLARTYTLQNGYYTKKGREVTANFVIQTASFSFTTASGNIQVTGLPYTAVNDANARFYATCVFGGITKAGYTAGSLLLIGNTSTILVVMSGSAVAPAAVAATDTPTGGTVILAGSITYVV